MPMASQRPSAALTKRTQTGFTINNDPLFYPTRQDRISSPIQGLSSFQTSVVEKPTRWHNFVVRGVWTLLMITSFGTILAAGHRYVIFGVIALQILIFKEVIDLARQPWNHKRLPWFRTISWYFLLTTNYFLYGESLIGYFKKPLLLDAFLHPVANHHRFISFSLYILGLVLFVLNLKKGYYKFQFGLFAWTHMALLLVTCQSHFVIINILEGLIWFILPVCLVICNDITAYIFGFFFGRTRLIEVSPRKTWEGFLGAFICTLFFAFFLSRWLAPYPYLTCPLRSLSVHGTCEPNPIFTPVPYILPPFLSSFLRHLMPWSASRFSYVTIAPIQLHALVFAFFSSAIAPFGGFFASGLKRAFKLKDFADSIPGHGGLTDRMDCQFLMGLFSYMYTSSFIKIDRMSLAYVLNLAVVGLAPQEQVELYRALHEYLVNQRILDI